MTLYELIANALDNVKTPTGAPPNTGFVGELDNELMDAVAETCIIAVIEWLRLDETKKAIYAAQEGTGTGPPLVSITEALVKLAQEEP